MKIWLRLAIVASALGLGYASYYATKKPDGFIEQAAETVLKFHGVDVDISPENE